MKFTLLFLGLIVGVGCNSSKISTQKEKIPKTISNDLDECKEHFAFIKSQWIETNKLYSFKGDPEYWKNPEKYNKFNCFKEKNMTDIEAIFGTPTKQFIMPKVTIWVYCMNEECKNVFMKYKNKKELVINFDEIGKMKSMYFNPTFQIRN